MTKMSTSVELTVILRNGTKKSFSKPTGHGDPHVDIKTLQKSLLSLQQESNSYLTLLVEQERDDQKTSENVTQLSGGNENDDGDSDDSEEDDKEDKEPVTKKQKR